MADWKRIDALKEKRREILEDPSMGREFRNKCLLCIDTQIRAELEREEWCRPKLEKIVGLQRQ